MASAVLLRLAIVIGLLAISATARPCKTLIISSYSFTLNPRNPIRNPSDNPSSSFSSSEYITFFTDFHRASFMRGPLFERRPFHYPRGIFISRRVFPGVGFVEEPQIQQPSKLHRPQSLFPFTDEDLSSLRDRTKDILSVVVGLLFGVGCGALTAATMYLFWALFANRQGYSVSFDHFDDDSDGDDDENPKKMGYVKIPAASPVDSVPSPKKEGA